MSVSIKPKLIRLSFNSKTIQQVCEWFGLSTPSLFCLTDPEDEVILDGVLSFAARGAQGAAGPLGPFLFLAGGLASSLCPL